MKEKVLKLIDERIKFWKSGKLPEHIKIVPEKMEIKTEDMFKFAHKSIVMELELIKKDIEKLEKEIKKSDIQERLDKCRKLRGLPEQLRHRTFQEFGDFIRDMADFLVFGVYSNNPDTKEFQKTIDRNKYNAEEFETYVELFEKFWRWLSEKNKEKTK
jgi:hypothetical protein